MNPPINSYIPIKTSRAFELVRDLRRRVAASLHALPTFTPEEVAAASDGLRKRKDHPDFKKAAEVAAAENIRAQLTSFAERAADLQNFFAETHHDRIEGFTIYLSFADYEFLTVDVSLKEFPAKPAEDPNQTTIPFPQS